MLVILSQLSQLEPATYPYATCLSQFSLSRLDISPLLPFLAQGGNPSSLSSSDDWLTQAIRNVLVGQAVVGTVALIGLFAIIKRFLSHEFPATMASINARLDTLHRDFEKLQMDFTQSLLANARLSEKVENLTRRVDNLEDGTMSRRRERPRESWEP